MCRRLLEFFHEPKLEASWIVFALEVFWLSALEVDVMTVAHSKFQELAKEISEVRECVTLRCGA